MFSIAMYIMNQANRRFRNAVRAGNLIDNDLSEQNLSGWDLRNLNLGSINFARADLEGAIFTGSNLIGTIFTGARLVDAIFTGENTNLTGAVFRDADLTRADFTDANLTGADLTDANLDGVNVLNANLTGLIGLPNGIPQQGVAHQGVAHQAVAHQGVAQQGVAHQGIAFQVHNAFNNLNIVKFMEIIRDNITPIYIEGELLEKLIVYSSTNLPAKTGELTSINARIKSYSAKNSVYVQDVITFVLLQPDPFIKMYIGNFTDDCLNAYNVGNRESCVKGQYERVFMNLEGVIGFTCNEVAGCPPVYKELLTCFKPNYNQLFRDWFAAGQHDDAEANYENKSPEKKKAYLNAKKAEFKAHVVRYIGERYDIDEYIDANFSQNYTSTYDGGRKRKTKKRINKKRKTKKRINKKRKTNKRKG